VSFTITLEEGSSLVTLARRAIDEYINAKRVLSVPDTTYDLFFLKCGVFVTLNIVHRGHKALRGCIGYPYPSKPLVEATIDAAINSAFRDPRFAPVRPEELSKIRIEVSILTPPTRIEVKTPGDYLREIKIGRDGLIVERGLSKGLLLPQVPVEWEWDAEEFLAHCCMKAGLTPDMWLVRGTNIYKFSCIVLCENQPYGEVDVIDMRQD
jgi:uncharacterized protein (TIGR00296 family)